MILYSRDASQDIARLRSFLDQVNPGAAQRAMALVFKAIENCRIPLTAGVTWTIAAFVKSWSGSERRDTSSATALSRRPKTF
jgi:hypothetical protein